MKSSLIFLYGPSGSGKSTAGRLLAEALALPFVDLDRAIETRAGKSIPELFAASGEAGFRQAEASCLRTVAAGGPAVVALGGGALLDEANRTLALAAGQVVCLNAGLEDLHQRLHGSGQNRPLLGEGDDLRQRLAALLERRKDHYALFSLQLDTGVLTPEQVCWRLQVKLGAFRISGMGEPYDVRVRRGGLEDVGEEFIRRGLKGPLALVSDSNTAPLYAGRVASVLEAAGYTLTRLVVPAGEEQKTVAAVSTLWQGFLEGGLERGSTVVALGGGVLTDLAGFAAATYLRGVRWAALPTSLLGMADASLGGKTGADLPQGKNLVGAFHPPALVLADPAVLASLPEVELRNGMAEVVKHGILADPQLFEQCAGGISGASADDLAELVRRAMAVKIQFIQADPFEKGLRAALNLGHTLGHAVETASDYRLRHGEAVAIGLVGEAQLAEHIGLAQGGLADTIRAVLRAVGLPVKIPAWIDRARLAAYLRVDKKKDGGRVKFALPQEIGRVKTGIVVQTEELQWMLER